MILFPQKSPGGKVLKPTRAEKRFVCDLTKDLDQYRLEDKEFVNRHPTYLLDLGYQKNGYAYAIRVPGASRGGVRVNRYGEITDITFDEVACYQNIPCYDRAAESVKEKYLGKIIEKPVVRAITWPYIDDVERMDKISGFSVADMIDDEVVDPADGGYAYGLFLGSELIGYCTIGGAECNPPKMIEHHACYTYDSLLLGDVFIKEKYQGYGFGTVMVMEARKLENPEEDLPIFLTLLDDSIAPFYKNIGWKWCDKTKKYAMVYIPKNYKNT